MELKNKFGKNEFKNNKNNLENNFQQFLANFFSIEKMEISL